MKMFYRPKARRAFGVLLGFGLAIGFGAAQAAVDPSAPHADYLSQLASAPAKSFSKLDLDALGNL